jgi:biotin carboxyl carrier protein
MSIYCVSIGEREYNVQITGSHVLVDGEPVKADLVSLNGNGLHVFRQGNRSREFYLNPQAQGNVEVLAEGRRVLAHVDLAGRRARRKDAAQAGEVVAPMPGLVVNVLVKAGEYVEKDQVLVVLESMKMQMQLKAPFTGHITQVTTTVGAQVEKGATLVQVREA